MSLFWQEANLAHHPRVLFSGDPSIERTPAVTWGISDLTIYATAFYSTIITDGARACKIGPRRPWGCTASARGFTMLRVRIWANAYFASVWGPYSTGNRKRPGVHFNFSHACLGGAQLAAATLTGKHWRVSDCDILTTGDVFYSGSSAGGYGGTSYGELSRNSMRNDGNALAMDQ